jgi:hypothetical protein
VIFLSGFDPSNLDLFRLANDEQGHLKLVIKINKTEKEPLF